LESIVTKHSSDRRALLLTGDDTCARRVTQVRKFGQISKLIWFAGLLLLGWSALFAYTYRSPFHWDDYHFIRHYSWDELSSTFHGWNDPDKIETPALRPGATLLFAFQGSIFGENIVLQRIFMIFLMWILLAVLGLLLLELGCGVFQIGLVFVLFVSSRIFASVNLWLTLGSLTLCYVFILLTCYFFLLWVREGRMLLLILMLICPMVAVSIREEAYVLPIVLPLVWFVSSAWRKHGRRVLVAAVGVFAIAAVHFLLRRVFVPEAPSPQFTIRAAKALLVAITASWLPGGYKTEGITDSLLANIWIVFLIGLVLGFMRVGRSSSRRQFIGACCMGCVLALPAIAVPRSFGIALPTLAFITAIGIAVGEVYHQLQPPIMASKTFRFCFVTCVTLGLVVGIGGGIRRSMYVAEYFHENCALRVERDGTFIFNLYKRHATVPDERKEAGRARLAAAGIYNADDVWSLHKDITECPGDYRRGRESREALFLPKYDYLSF